MRTGYLIDMDGVIYRENQLIAGAADFVAALLSSGTPFLFLTNNSAPTPEDLAEYKLQTKPSPTRRHTVWESWEE